MTVREGYKLLKRIHAIQGNWEIYLGFEHRGVLQATSIERIAFDKDTKRLLFLGAVQQPKKDALKDMKLILKGK